MYTHCKLLLIKFIFFWTKAWKWLYLFHVLSWYIRISDRNEIWAWNLYHFFVEVAKSLAPSNIKGHGKVPYQKPQLKSMVHGVYPRTHVHVLAQCSVCVCTCISTIHSANSTSTEYNYTYSCNFMLCMYIHTYMYIRTCIYIHGVQCSDGRTSYTDELHLYVTRP